MNKAIISMILFLLAPLAWGEDGYVSSRADFDALKEGTRDVFLLTDQGKPFDRSGKQSFHWLRRSAAGKTAAEVVTDGGVGQALKVDSPMTPGASLARTIVPRGDPLAAIQPVMASNDTHETICYELRTQFKACSPDPVIGVNEKIMVWMKAPEEEGVNAALYVTCGRFESKFQSATAYNCRVEIPDDFNTNAWHTLAFRTLPDITAGGKLCGFTISLDGTNLVGTADYQVLGPNFADSALLTAEARILIDERRLFPACGGSGSDVAVLFNGLAFRGRSQIDDIVITNAPAEELKPDTVFSLRWDVGVASFAYAVDGGEVTTPTDLQLQMRRLDVVARSGVTVSGVRYDTAGGFTPGVWNGVGCTATTNAQGGVFEGFTSSLPIGYIVSGSDALTVGGEGGYATFDEAIYWVSQMNKADPVLRLGGGEVFVPTNLTYDGEHHWGYPGGLRLSAGTLPDGVTLTLDLCGRTLKGAEACPAPISVTDGRLRIIDTVGGGRIEPYANYFAAAGSPASKIAIIDYPTKPTEHPVLIIEDGKIAGEIARRRLGAEAGGEGSVEIGGGEFASTNSETFALADCVTNAALYYAHSDGYWSAVATNAVIWCGKGGNSNWSNGDNWKGGKVPGKGDLVIFPSGTNVWNVTFDGKAIESDLWIDGNVVATGTADMTLATVRGGTGDGFAGDATFVWRGKVPRSLADVFSPNWAGTVKVVDIGSATELSGIDTWGTLSSKVVFNNVKGHISVYKDLDLPYELVLEGDGWTNQAGYSGSTVTFRKLSGSGPFVAKKPMATIRQVIRFRDVSDYKGKFKIEDKRIIVGDGDAMASVGSIAYSKGVTVNSDCGWETKTAFFEASFTAVGSVDGTLLTYNGTAPDVSGAVVFVRDGENVTTNGLTLSGSEVKFTSQLPEGVALLESGDVVRLYTQNALKNLKAGSTFRLLGASAKADGNTVTLGGETVQTLADYYTLKTSADGVVTVALGEKAVPVIGDLGVGASAEREDEDGIVWVVVKHARRGLFYGLKFSESLAGFGEKDVAFWQPGPEEDDGEVQLYMTVPKSDSGFYGVVVSDRDPAELAEEEGKEEAE